MVTRDDVARAAGTSPAVVSYVVNNGPRSVAEATRRRVEQAIRETGYRPNGVARALRDRRSRVIGLVVPDSANAFFAGLAQVVENEAYRRGYYLMLGNSAEDGEREAGYVRAFLEQRVVGLVLVSAGSQRRLAAQTATALSSSDAPLVLVHRNHRVKGANVLLVDNEQGARLATSHLIYDHGILQVGCLAGPPGLPLSDERIEGWRSALSAVPSDVADTDVRHSPFNRLRAFEVALDWLQSKAPPRAIFACTDEQAIGVIAAAGRLKLRIPEDLALVSFDGTPNAEYTTPGLTTVEQPLEEIGRRAVDLILKEKRHDRRAVERFATRLVVRASCGCGDDSWSLAGAYERVQLEASDRLWSRGGGAS